MLIALIIVSVLLLAALGVVLLLWQSLLFSREEYTQLGVRHDHTLLDMQRQKDAAQAVVPFLAKTSVAMFYGEENGVQYSFAQRQEIARKVQTQNEALRRFNDIFGVTTTHEMMARANYGDPVAKAAVEELANAELVEELGLDVDLPPASNNPWPS